MPINKPAVGSQNWGTALNAALNEMDVTIPTSTAAGALSGTYARKPANTAVILGTSITELAYGAGTSSTLFGSVPSERANGARGYFTWAQSFLAQRVGLLKNAGVAGNTTAQMLARLQADVIDLAPAWCVVEVGPNDASGDVAVATTQANLTSIITTLQAAGIRVAVATPTTTTGHTAAQKQAVFDVARWLRSYALTENRSVVLADFLSVWADPATGAPVTVLTDDGSHPSADGAQRLGKVLADALSPFIPAVRHVATSNADTGNLFTNGMLTGDVSGLATSWAISNGNGGSPNTRTPTKVARTDGLPGEWQQIAIGSGNAGMPQLTAPTVTTGFTVGLDYEALIEFESDAGVVINADTQRYMQANLIALGSSGELARAVWAWRISSEKNWTVWPRTGVMRTPPLTLPTGTTSLVFQAIVRGVDTGTFRFASAILRRPL